MAHELYATEGARFLEGAEEGDDNNETAKPAQPGDTWTCSMCKFENVSSTNNCQMCDAKRHIKIEQNADDDDDDDASPPPSEAWLSDDITIGLAGNNKYDDLKSVLETKYNLTGSDLIIQTQKMINIFHQNITPQSPVNDKIFDNSSEKVIKSKTMKKKSSNTANTANTKANERYQRQKKKRNEQSSYHKQQRRKNRDCNDNDNKRNASKSKPKVVSKRKYTSSETESDCDDVGDVPFKSKPKQKVPSRHIPTRFSSDEEEENMDKNARKPKRKIDKKKSGKPASKSKPKVVSKRKYTSSDTESDDDNLPIKLKPKIKYSVNTVSTEVNEQHNNRKKKKRIASKSKAKKEAKRKYTSSDTESNSDDVGDVPLKSKSKQKVPSRHIPTRFSSDEEEENMDKNTRKIDKKKSGKPASKSQRSSTLNAKKRGILNAKKRDTKSKTDSTISATSKHHNTETAPSGDTWNCSMCTFKNALISNYCQMCGTKRDSKIEQNVQNNHNSSETSNNTASFGGKQTTKRKESQPLQQVKGWEIKYTNDGKKYYQNDITKETSWDIPAAYIAAAWSVQRDDKGRIYYKNDITKQTSWTKPADYIEPETPKPSKTSDGLFNSLFGGKKKTKQQPPPQQAPPQPPQVVYTQQPQIVYVPQQPQVVYVQPQQQTKQPTPIPSKPSNGTFGGLFGGKKTTKQPQAPPPQVKVIYVKQPKSSKSTKKTKSTKTKGLKLKQPSNMKCKFPYKHPKFAAVVFLLGLGWNLMGFILSIFCIMISMDLEEYYSVYQNNSCVSDNMSQETVSEFGAISYVVCVLSIVSLIMGCVILNVEGCASKVVANIFYAVLMGINAIFMFWIFGLCTYFDNITFSYFSCSLYEEEYDEIHQDFITMYLFIALLAAIVFCIIFGVVKGGYSRKIIGCCIC